MIRSVVYRSLAATRFVGTVDLEILETAWARNRALGVTGYLVRADATYLQCLEGSAQALSTLLHSIAQDTRHSAFEILQDTAIAERRFANWAMGYHAGLDEALQQNLALHATARFPVDSVISFMQGVAREREANSRSALRC